MKNYNELSKVVKYNRLAKIAKEIGKDDFYVETEFSKVYSNRYNGKLTVTDLAGLKLLIEIYAISIGKVDWLKTLGTKEEFIELAKKNIKK